MNEKLYDIVRQINFVTRGCNAAWTLDAQQRLYLWKLFQSSCYFHSPSSQYWILK